MMRGGIMNPSRLVLVWRVSERCDTACGFCAYDVRLRRSRRELDAAEALRFGGLVAEWARGREVLVSWLGGEPFLWRDLERVSQALAERGLRLGVTTNGRALFDAARLSWAARWLDEITVSLDGPPELHDRLRGRPGLGQGVLEVIARLRAAGARLIRVNTVLMRANIGAFEELVQRVAAAGAHELTFNALGGNDRPEFFARERLRVEDVRALSAALPAWREHILIRGEPAYLGRLLASAEGTPVSVEDCGPGRSFWFIEVDGRLAPCSFTAAAYGIPLASLHTVADLDALPARFAAARTHARAAVCDDCPSTQVHAKFA
jgi:AdoMet-dependent heme synthase